MFPATVEKNRIQEIELRQEAGYWQAQHRRAVERESALRVRNQELEALLRRQKAEITQKDREIEKLKAKNAWLQQQVFGRKTNRMAVKSCNDAEASPVSPGSIRPIVGTIPARSRSPTGHRQA